MPGCSVSAIMAILCATVKRRRRATPALTSIFEDDSDIGVSLGPPAKQVSGRNTGAVSKKGDSLERSLPNKRRPADAGRRSGSSRSESEILRSQTEINTTQDELEFSTRHRAVGIGADDRVSSAFEPGHAIGHNVGILPSEPEGLVPERKD